MSQLARRENAPHRAAFVTSLSRWYIRRLLGNLPPFHPCLSARGGPVLPLAGLRHPTDIFLGNQGTASPFCLPPSVSGTGRAHRHDCPGLPGHLFAWSWLPGVHALRHSDPCQRQFGRTPGRCDTKYNWDVWGSCHRMERRLGVWSVLLMRFWGSWLCWQWHWNVLGI